MKANETDPRSDRAAPQRGFTLIELLIVIGILGALAAVLLPNILGATDASNRETTNARMLQLNSAAEAFQRKHGFFPPDDFRSPAKELVVDWKADNGQNSGIESFVAFVSMSQQGGTDLSGMGAALVNTDKDDNGVEHKLLRRKDRVEVADAWGTPIAYFTKANFGKMQQITSQFGDPLPATAKKDARGNYHGGKYQFLSAGKDGAFGTDDDLVFPENGN